MLVNNHKINCVLVSKKKEAEGVITLRFKIGKNSGFSFVPGQYVIIYLKGQSGPEGKAYTISSIPGDKFLSITVKKVGKFSTALHELKIGSIVIMDGPMGYFFPEEKSEEIVFLAAGIGITPFFSVIRAYIKNNLLNDKKIYLFYSNRAKESITFFDELNKFSENNKNIKIFYYLTRQEIKDKYIREFQRIDAKSIKSKLSCLDNKNYFICGPISFVSDIRKILLNEGISELNICTESFY